MCMCEGWVPQNFGSLKPGVELADVTSVGLTESERCVPPQPCRNQLDRGHSMKLEYIFIFSSLYDPFSTKIGE